MRPKHFVYVLRSTDHPRRYYVGLTSDLLRRLEIHNSGGSASTAEHRPWRVIVYLRFSVEKSAVDFERYLKSGSGRAFAKRHFVEQLAYSCRVSRFLRSFQTIVL
jgi:predicted GIY-YIG superfamily endonuclease